MLAKAATDWGSVPAWFAMGTAAVAVATYVNSRRETARASASRVYLIIQRFDLTGPPDDRTVDLVVRIVNDSDQAVLDIGLSLWGYGRRRTLWRVRPHGEWMTSKRLTGRVVGTIAPNTKSLDLEIHVTSSSVGSPRGIEVRPPIVLAFTDGNGRRWIRWHNGRLTRQRLSRRIR